MQDLSGHFFEVIRCTRHFLRPCLAFFFLFRYLLGAFCCAGILKITNLSIIASCKIDDTVICSMSDAVGLNPDDICSANDFRFRDILTHKTHVGHFELDLAQPGIVSTECNNPRIKRYRNVVVPPSVISFSLRMMTQACGNNGLCSERLCRRQYVWQQQIGLSVCGLFPYRLAFILSHSVDSLHQLKFSLLNRPV